MWVSQRIQLLVEFSELTCQQNANSSICGVRNCEMFAIHQTTFPVIVTDHLQRNSSNVYNNKPCLQTGIYHTQNVHYTL